MKTALVLLAVCLTLGSVDIPLQSAGQDSAPLCAGVDCMQVAQ